jgi:hypothetical protein
MLEYEYSWRGILAEPARRNHQKLREARKCIVDDRCVRSESGASIGFVEARESELSCQAGLTLRQFTERQEHRIFENVVLSSREVPKHDSARRIEWLVLQAQRPESAYGDENCQSPQPRSVTLLTPFASIKRSIKARYSIVFVGEESRARSASPCAFPINCLKGLTGCDCHLLTLY